MMLTTSGNQNALEDQVEEVAQKRSIHEIVSPSEEREEVLH